MSAIRWLTGASLTRATATLLVGAAIGGTLVHQVHRAIDTRAALQRAEQSAQQQRETLRAIEAAQTHATRLQERADAAERTAQERTSLAQRANAAARTELERLRNALATTLPADAPACSATADRADTLAAVQRECAGALVELGRAADAHATDALRLFQGWPAPPD